MTDDSVFDHTDADGDRLRVVPGTYGVESVRVVYFHNSDADDAISVRLGEASARGLRDALSVFLGEDAPADPFAETVPDRIRPTVTESGDRIRMTSLEIVSRMSVAGLRVEDIVDAARVVEAYLRGVDAPSEAPSEEPDETLTARRNLERTPMEAEDERTGPKTDWPWPPCQFCGHANHGTVTCRTRVTLDTVTRACTCRGV